MCDTVADPEISEQGARYNSFDLGMILMPLHTFPIFIAVGVESLINIANIICVCYAVNVLKTKPFPGSAFGVWPFTHWIIKSWGEIEGSGKSLHSL